MKHLFDESRQIPVLASATVQRWALLLSSYNYTIQHRPGTQIANADALSRLPLPDVIDHVPEPGDHTVLIHHLNETLVTASQIKLWTDKDPVLSRIHRFVQCGWSDSEEDRILKPYINRKDEMTVLDGCVLWGSRVVIPAAGRKTILEELHEAHPGNNKMKSLARCFVWWPGIDSDIVNCVRNCMTCQQHQTSPSKAPLHSWEWPHRPWARVHIDHAGPFLGHLFLIVVDAHSKWIEAQIVPSTSSEATIKKLQEFFATHGYPEQIVSDNGTGFTSSEFQSFMKKHGILYTLTAPYHPSSNGMAERSVQTVKQGLKKLTGPIGSRLAEFLLRYRTTPQTSTGLSPSELLMGRRLRCKLTLLHPDAGSRVKLQQERMCMRKSKLRSFSEGEKLYAKAFSISSKGWIPATVEARTGPLSYRLRTEDGSIIRRHVDHVRIRYPKSNCLPEHLDGDDWPLRPVTSSATTVTSVPSTR